ncbi:MAG: inosine/xanthosine triphosphatase [Parcubacteria group bacterium]|nr:inosine/xanthosine triphosphatase [Parcubacteria group bacterium]
MKIAVGSKNPVKIEAARAAFQKVWPDKKFKIHGLAVESGVSKQPMSDKEAILGARNRAKLAVRALKADFGVGLEGGTQKINKDYFECGWIVILDKNNNESIGSTIKMLIPLKMVAMMKKGMELGEINDAVFKRKNSKQIEGHFGLMTKNALTRTKAYQDGVIAALVKFIHPDLF